MAATPPGTGTDVPMDFETALSVDAVEEAARELAYEQIEAIVIDTGEHEHRLIEIDENLMRAELTHLDRGRFLAERKRIYFELHPTRRHGGDRRSDTFAEARRADRPLLDD